MPFWNFLSQENYLNLNVADNFFVSNEARMLNVFIRYLQKWLSMSFTGHDGKTVLAKYSSYQTHAQWSIEIFNLTFYWMKFLQSMVLSSPEEKTFYYTAVEVLISSHHTVEQAQFFQTR